MPQSRDRTLVCSVLFLDIVGYSREATADQAQLKQALNRALAAALESVPTRDRVIIDTGDGAAITFFGDPENALSVAMTIRDSLGGLPVRMGINLGPVRMVADVNDQTNIIGDGINVAQRVMSFSKPGQLLVSRSFYEVVSCLSSEYENVFAHEGARTDKHVRAHDLYSVAADARIGQKAAKRKEQSPATRAADASYVEGRHARDSDEDDADQNAQIFDAGPNLIVVGYSKSRVQQAVDQLAQSGSRVISPLAKVGRKWMAACEHPDVPVSACKVEKLGFTHIVTGPTQEAVAVKVGELVQFGAVLVGDIEFAGGKWTAVCDASGAERHA